MSVGIGHRRWGYCCTGKWSWRVGATERYWCDECEERHHLKTALLFNAIHDVAWLMARTTRGGFEPAK